MSQAGRSLTGFITKRQWGRVRFACFSIIWMGGSAGRSGIVGADLPENGVLGPKRGLCMQRGMFSQANAPLCMQRAVFSRANASLCMQRSGFSRANATLCSWRRRRGDHAPECGTLCCRQWRMEVPNGGGALLCGMDEWHVVKADFVDARLLHGALTSVGQSAGKGSTGRLKPALRWRP